ncbi:uncharacterized protein B0P05DRAFT_12786 [Gilbertella persicaria]|uniref:uncharacterized protein n=1 Tax=Gilbertella persicaria TaxID=101096 RepID=UPI00221E8E41|nr:uncharacterized protein B0P05DRAFT_12786 [Gilbertella persicaria]KAI8086836.1 hypothetical protein B0P05DRAFT_12786 [Gilbertella persicaria]
MFQGAKELRVYIENTEKPTLNEFAATHAQIITSTEHTLKRLINLWKVRFSFIVKRYRPTLSVKELITVDHAIWKQFDSSTAELSRSLLFQWYFLLQDKSDYLDTYLKQNDLAIERIRRKSNDRIPDALEKLSVSLLENFDLISNTEKNVLKMSLSYIVDLIDDDIAKIYRRFIPEYYFDLWQQKEAAMQIEGNEREIIESTVDEFISQFSTSIKSAKRFVLQQQIELLDNENATKKKVVNMLQQIVMLLERDEQKMQKADYVGFVKQLLLDVFKGTPLVAVIGETGAKCTVDVQKYNANNFLGAANSTHIVSSSPISSSSTNADTSSCKLRKIHPRKIDLRIIGEKQQEIAFCEFKTHNAGKDLLQHQESKAIRLNQCIIKKHGLVNPITSINWKGWHGTMYQIVGCDGFCLATKLCDVLIPSDRRLVDSRIKSLVLSLFSWKSMLCSLNDEVSKKINEVGVKRKMYEDMPHTLLSPKHPSSLQ